MSDHLKQTGQEEPKKIENEELACVEERDEVKYWAEWCLPPLGATQAQRAKVIAL